MNKSKCPVCGSLHTQKNGKRKGIQTFRCGDCGYQFRNSRLPTEASLWKLYQSNKQTVSELAETFGVSDSTIKRCLRNVSMKWEQPMVEGSGYVHLDATYWGHNWGVMLGLDDAAGLPLYMDFIRSETTPTSMRIARGCPTPTTRLRVPYSSRSCSPAELRYASDCTANVGK